MNKYLTPVKGDHFRIIINSSVEPRRDILKTSISFEYYPEDYGGVTVSEEVLSISSAIVVFNENKNQDIIRAITYSSFVEATKRNPSKFIVDTLTDLANKAVKLRERFIKGVCFEEFSDKRIVIDTKELEERGLLNYNKESNV